MAWAAGARRSVAGRAWRERRIPYGFPRPSRPFGPLRTAVPAADCIPGWMVRSAGFRASGPGSIWTRCALIIRNRRSGPLGTIGRGRRSLVAAITPRLITTGLSAGLRRARRIGLARRGRRFPRRLRRRRRSLGNDWGWRRRRGPSGRRHGSWSWWGSRGRCLGRRHYCRSGHRLDGLCHWLGRRGLGRGRRFGSDDRFNGLNDGSRRLRFGRRLSRLGSLAFSAGSRLAFGGLAFLLLPRQFDGPLAGASFILGQAMRRRGFARLLGRADRGRGRGTAHVECRGGPSIRRMTGRGRHGRFDAPALGLNHHCLGAAMAEALLHHPGADRTAGARLQRQRRAGA